MLIFSTALTRHYIADILVGYIESVTRMTIGEFMAMLQDHDSSDRMATKTFWITWIFSDPQIITV